MQESVWDYPRPPRLETFAGPITVELSGKTIASTMIVTSSESSVCERGAD